MLTCLKSKGPRKKKRFEKQRKKGLVMERVTTASVLLPHCLSTFELFPLGAQSVPGKKQNLHTDMLQPIGDKQQSTPNSIHFLLQYFRSQPMTYIL